MSLSINTVKTVLGKVNSKGASLLRKDTGLDISKAVNEGFKTKLPEEAVTFDAVRVGRQNNPTEHYTDVFTFRNKHGEIVNRYIKEVDGKNVKETFKGYEELYPDEKELSETGDEFINIFGKKVRSYTRENGKINKIQEDTFAVTDEAKPYVTHYQRKITPAADDKYTKMNHESILLEQRRNGEQPRFIRNEYNTDKYTTGDFELINSSASSKELEDIAQNTYLLPYVSPTPKFANRMANACIMDEKFIAVDPEINLYKKASERNGYYSASGTVNVNLKSSKDLARTRESLTETIGHEVGHAKWDEKCSFYDFYKAGIDEGDFLRHFSKDDIPDIKRYKYSSEHYITPEMDQKGYRTQFCEKVAQDAGKKALKKYVKLSEDINNEFPNMHIFQFYKLNRQEDDFQSLLNLMKIW